MPKTVDPEIIDEKVQARLLALHDKLGTWAKVEEALPFAVSVPQLSGFVGGSDYLSEERKEQILECTGRAEDESLIALIQAGEAMKEFARRLEGRLEREVALCKDDRLRRVAQSIHSSVRELKKTAKQAQTQCQKHCR